MTAPQPGSEPPPPHSARHGEWLPVAALAASDARTLRGFAAIVRSAQAAGVDLGLQRLPFYRAAWLLRLITREGSEFAPAFGIWSTHGLHPIDGSSTPVHDANRREGLLLDEHTVLAYVVWFCRHVHGGEGPFWVVLGPDDFNDGGPARADDRRGPGPQSLIVPPSVAARADGPGWRVTVPVQYGDTLFKATFCVDPDGGIEMEGDEPLAAGIPFDEACNVLPPAWSVGPEGLAFAAARDAAPAHPSQRAVQKSVGDALVRLQLLQALRAGEAAALFSTTAGDDEALLREFAEFVVSSAALVVIESRTDYVERIVGDLLIGALGRRIAVKRSSYALAPEPGVQLPTIDDGDLVEISLHESPHVRRPQAVAFVLASTDAAALIGCRGRGEVPEPLRQIADLTLALPPLGPAAFRALFADVFACDCPADAPGEAAWLAYLEPTDLQRALRDRLFREAAAGAATDWRPEQAVAAIAARAVERLQRFLPDEPRRLADLAGLGEARRILEDALADFVDALAGRVSWDDVDRGLLLVGPPGTGKTMLARVLAQECGFRFVSARISGWMTGDAGLGSVIAAMRQTFVDARQYAPCILFLDEIDSLGSRASFGGHNSTWDTAFLTAVLAEFQGFEQSRGVFVIAATNHEDQVDPALRRAGRLDQVVRLQLPAVDELAVILGQYLAPFRAAGRVATNVDLAAVAGALAGATGAQVELCVRDAARRARRAGTPIDSRQLLAAATGVARRPPADTAGSAAERERTAYHEAGHAIAQLAARRLQAELSVVSIVGRDDGSLGFVGVLPGDVTGWTAAHYDEYLQVMLAGRAAEDLRYGSDAVSTGAAGPAASSDLAIATALAVRRVCRSAVDPGHGLHWRSEPQYADDAMQVRAVLTAGYERTRRLLQQHWPLLQALVARLLVDRQLLGSEVRAFAAERGLVARAPAGRRAEPAHG